MRRGGIIVGLGLLLASLALWWAWGLGARDPEADPYGADAGAADPDEAGLEGREHVGRTPEHARDPGSQPVTDEPVDTAGVALTGRVVDTHRRPVAGARVAAHFPDRPVRETQTDAGGAYVLPLGTAPAVLVLGTVRATAPGPRVGAVPLAIQPGMPARQSVRTLVVDQAFDVDVQVRYAGAPEAGAEVVVAYEVWNRMTPIASGRTDAAGRFQARGVPRGQVRIFAAHAGRGRNHFGLRLPRTESGPVVLELLEPRALAVRVVDQETGRPVAGARVHVGDRYTAATGSTLALLPPLELEPTDAAGWTDVPTLNPREAYFVNAEADGYAPPNPYLGSGMLPVPPDAREVTFALRRFRTVTFPLDASGARPPDEGATLRLEVQAWIRPQVDASASARIESGRLVIEGLPASWINGRVVAPRGVFATFIARPGETQGDAVRFQETLEARVRLIEQGGGPMPGARLTWRGGFAFGNQKVSVTDARGEALLEGMSQGRVEIVLLAPGEAWHGAPIGTFDLDPATARDVHVIEVPPSARVTLEVTLDGVPGLPLDYQLRLGGRGVAQSEIEEDAERGTLRLVPRLADTGKPIQVELRAQGFVPATAAFRLGSDIDIALGLRPAARLETLVLPPEDGDFALRVERFDGAADTWVSEWTARAERGAEGGMGGRQERSVRAFLLQTGGRFRVRDMRSGLVSDAADVVPGSTASLTLDLGRAVWVPVQVDAAPGTDLRRARVFRLDVPAGHPMDSRGGVGADRRGQARVRALRGEELELSVSHPLAVAAAEGGTAHVVAGSKSPVVLRLEVGSVLVFKLAAARRRGAPPGRAARVLLFAGSKPVGPAVREGLTIVSAGRQQFGGYPPGTYTIWIDAFRGAPIVLTGRALGAGTTDLGLLTPAAGGRIRVRLLLDAGDASPALFVVARRSGTPRFSRDASRRAGRGEALEDELTVEGLPAGSYEVELRLRGAGGAGRVLPAQTVDVDGQGEATVRFDLRGG